MTNHEPFTTARLFTLTRPDMRLWDRRISDPCKPALEPVIEFVRHMLATDPAEYAAIRNLDGTLDHDDVNERIDDAVVGFVNSVDGRSGQDYDVVVEFLSSFELPDPDPVRVVFRSFSPGAGWNSPDGIIALMPDSNDGRAGMCDSYMHHGQHDAASSTLVDTLYRCSAMDYAPGVDELVRRGYLPVVDRAPGGITVAPSSTPHNLVVPSTFGHVQRIRRNYEAYDLCNRFAEFANRSYTLRGRHVYVPPGTTVEYEPGRAAGRNHGAVLRRPSAAGVRGDTEFVSFGLLPLDYARSLVSMFRAVERSTAPFVYLVQSYATPLAAHGAGDVLVPRVQYSLSTTRHARAVFGAGWDTPTRLHTDPAPPRA